VIGTELHAAQILDAADAALYTAKRLGRDRVEFATLTAS
jgi:PleD family two-component response regulator